MPLTDIKRWEKEAVMYIRDQKRPKGEFVRDIDATIDAWDVGYTMGWNAFDYTRTYNRKIWQGKEHTERVFRSLKYVGIDPQISPEENLRICEEVVERNKHILAEYDELGVWQEFTMGVYGLHGRHMTEGDKPVPTVICKTSPLEIASFSMYWNRGVHAITPATMQIPSMCFDAKVKSYNRLNSCLAMREVKQVDPEGVTLMLDIWGNIAEGATWSPFVVRDGKIYAPFDRNILPSCSRANVINLANQLNIPVILQDLQPFHLYTADEGLMASTPINILPLSCYNDTLIGKEVPGPVSKRLLKAWSDMVGFDVLERSKKALSTLTEKEKSTLHMLGA
jgi:branched-chain amino acid aminotransferase